MGKRRHSHSWVPIHARELNAEINFAHDQVEQKTNDEKAGLTSSASFENMLNGNASLPDPANGYSTIFKSDTYFPILQANGSAKHDPVEYPHRNGTTKNRHEFKRRHNTLWQRFLEHVGIGFYVFGFVISPFFFALIGVSLLFIPLLWPLLIAYACWFIYDYSTPKCGSRPWKAFRQLRVWNWMADYFPMRLIKTTELSTDRNYIIGSHPHGILSFATFLTFCTEAGGFSDLFPELERRYAVTLPVQYWFPLRREWLMFSNTISSEMSAIEHVLGCKEGGTAVGLVAGGAAEALDSQPDNFKLTLKHRKGFIKLALKTGSSLIPMYTFGETSTYKMVSNEEGTLMRKIQNSLKHSIGITMPFIQLNSDWKRLFGLLPERVPLTSIVGEPIHVEKVEDPTDKQINHLHKQYLNGLSKLFDEHKQKYGIGAKVKLEFI